MGRTKMQTVLPSFFLQLEKLEIITFNRNKNHFDNMEKYKKIQQFLTFNDSSMQ